MKLRLSVLHELLLSSFLHLLLFNTPHQSCRSIITHYYCIAHCRNVRALREFLISIRLKSKHLNWNVNEWKATRPSLKVFRGKLSKWEPCKSCKIPYKTFFGHAVYPIHTNSLFWVILVELPFCHFSPPNTSILGKDSKI